MQWDEKEFDTQFSPNVYFWTPNSEILAKALIQTTRDVIIRDYLMEPGPSGIKEF